MKIGERLRQARINAGLTQEDVSKELFVTRQTVSRWEQEKNLPNLYVLQDLSKLYEVEIAYFLTKEVENQTEKKSQINFYALFGVICFNVFFASFAYLVMLAFLFTLWIAAVFFICIPTITALLDLRSQGQIKFHFFIANKEFNPGHPYFNAFLFAMTGLILLPFLFLLTRKIFRLTKRYVRYNIKSIRTSIRY